MRAHFTVLILAVALFAVLVSFEVNIFHYSPPVPYAERESITLDDFNGFKIPGQKLQGQNSFAFITSTIDWQLRDNSVQIISYFHPARSFVYIDDLENEDLLRHEIYHFHITELGARKFREEVSQFEVIPEPSYIQTIYQSIAEETYTMQRQYDFDTNHGYLLGKQIGWQNKVDSLLSASSDYEKDIIEF